MRTGARTDWKGALTPRGWGFVAAAVLALIAAQVMGRRDLLQLTVFLSLVPVAALASNLLFRPSMEVRRVPRPDVVEAGTTTEVSLRLRHSGLLAGRMSMAEHLPATLGTGPAFLYPGRSVARDGFSSYRYQLGCPRRGVYLIGPVEARYTDPFGLAERHSRIGDATRLVVTPASVPLAATVLSGTRGADGVVATRVQSTPSDDDVMTREYRHGDPMRRVHWAATARHGELMVRQEESATSPEATLVLDVRRLAFPAGHSSGVGPESPAFEWAVTAVMSVAAHLAERDYSLRLLDTTGGLALARSASAPDPEAPSYSGPDGLASIAEGLAAIAPRSTGPGQPGHRPPDAAADEPGASAAPAVSSVSAASAVSAGFSELLIDRLEAHRSRGPIVVVLGATSPEAAAMLAPAAAFADRALALLVTPRAGGGEAAAEVLRDAGWRVAEATPRLAVDAAWLALSLDEPAAPRGTPAPRGTAAPHSTLPSRTAP